ncbi:sigma-54-dependent Fis family transcriptional regulator [Halomonas sp. ML-15]|uniref:sigma-54-dependent Fis family transcriptional regulator n=1 Tax=Halomonas sp. ML-15 TaxID=2773305 RepID=UPI001745D57F|nr:sigma-54-dependent Fis family transcriptional regulator [Halomonas sp. ML-15]MBD3895723.1 sigma-54-dependent Fis family transcriptional regulator [Halomonas sp. ML-15]
MLSSDNNHRHASLERKSRRGMDTVPARMAQSEVTQEALIEASWRRCKAVGLAPEDEPELNYVAKTILSDERERLDSIRRIARAELDLLYGQIAGTRFAVALANESGMIMDARADSDFKRVAHERNIRLGSLWQESLRGTNALGTCALVQHPVLVHAGEHYLDRYKTLTCAAAPIFDPDGQIIAILDASSDSCPRPPHTLALVNFSAKTIEMGYFREQYQQHLILSFHSRREYRYTVSAGLIALTPDGQLLAANRQALFILDGLNISRDSHFNDLFTSPFGDVIDKVLATGETMVADHVGSHYFLSVENTNLLHTTHTLQSRADMSTTDVERGQRVSDSDPQQEDPCLNTRFVANDPQLLERLKYLNNAVKRSLPILITGETGTGKEVFAKYIHQASGREGDFVPVNCGAIPENLVESELFGYVDGAFTGSRKGGADGLFHQANGGTIFLDELGELPLATQVKLLRVLDNRRYRKVGGTNDIRVDIQIVAATNANLHEAVMAGGFRSDLFYRLSTISIQLPNICERSDFADLAQHILKKIDPTVTLSRCGLDELQSHDWPGNIRELRNFLTRLVVLNDERKVTRKHVLATFEMEALVGIPDPNRQREKVHAVSQPDNDSSSLRPAVTGASDTRQRLLAERIQRACKRHMFNVSKVARDVGVSRSTVYKYLKQSP